jgi:probable HAF family extracellular repeat protein
VAGSFYSNYVLYPATIQQGNTYTIATSNRTAEATGINANGDVVGFFPNVPGGWIAPGGTTTPTATAISVADSTIKLYPMAINDNGLIAGNYIKVTAGNLHNYLIRAFTYDSVHGFQDIGTLPGGTSVEVAGMNNLGQIVGSALTREGATHAFVYDGAKMIDLGTLDGNASYATGINDRGVIVGVALDSSGNEIAFRTSIKE